MPSAAESWLWDCSKGEGADEGGDPAGAGHNVWQPVQDGEGWPDSFCQGGGKEKKLCHNGIGKRSARDRDETNRAAA